MTTGDQKRKVLVDAASAHIIGAAESRQSGADAIRAQSFQIATAVKQWFDGGYEPANMIRMLLSGACFLADNCGVSREQLIKVITMATAPSDAELIWKPQGV